MQLKCLWVSGCRYRLNGRWVGGWEEMGGWVGGWWYALSSGNIGSLIGE